MITTTTVFRRIAFWSAVVPLSLLIVIAAALTLLVNALLDNAAWVARTHEAMAQGEITLKFAIDMETGLRGFQITGDSKYLEPYFNADARIDREFDQWLPLVADSTQRQRAAEARRRFELWRNFARTLLAQKDEAAKLGSAALNAEGKQLMDKTREAFATFADGHLELLRGRQAKLDRLRRRFHVTGVPLLVGAGIGLAVFTNRQLRRLGVTYEEASHALLQTQDRLRRAADELEQKVKERTSELELANERLKDLDRLKSEFLATMSHELRTPLNSIIGFTGLVKEEMAGPVSPEQKEFLGMAYRSGKHLLNLINDLLDVSRIEAGKVELYFEEFDPREIADEVLETVRPMAEEKNLSVVPQLELPPRIHSDRKKLYQILLNLVNNAVKFTKEGEVRVVSRIDGRRLYFDVIDTGIGITPEQLQRLFEAFRQVEGSARRVYEGTGLGLYLSKKLVHLLGGEIGATSEAGRGSTFSFWIPLQEGGAHGAANTAR